MNDHPGIFYYDFRSPEAYLAAERVSRRLEWIPVDSSALPAADTFEGFRCETDRLAYLESVEARAVRHGLQPVVWPAPFPAESVRPALLTATYARSLLKTVAFSLAAFRQAFAGGRDLGVVENVLIAGSACEIHPRAILQALDRPAIATALDTATAEAVDRGVRDVPAVWLPDGRVLHGEDAVVRVEP